jgi:hypothetical protein
MVLKVGKLVSCWEDSWVCGVGRGGGIVFGAEAFKASTSAWAATVLSGLWVSYEGLQMIAGGMFVVCAWFGWLFERWLGLVLWLLGTSLLSESPFQVFP